MAATALVASGLNCSNNAKGITLSRELEEKMSTKRYTLEQIIGMLREAEIGRCQSKLA